MFVVGLLNLGSCTQNNPRVRGCLVAISGKCSVEWLCSSSVGKHIWNEITQYRSVIQVFGSNRLWCSKCPVLPHVPGFWEGEKPTKYVSVLRIPILSNLLYRLQGMFKAAGCLLSPWWIF